MKKLILTHLIVSVFASHVSHAGLIKDLQAGAQFSLLKPLKIEITTPDYAELALMKGTLRTVAKDESRTQLLESGACLLDAKKGQTHYDAFSAKVLGVRVEGSQARIHLKQKAYLDQSIDCGKDFKVEELQALFASVGVNLVLIDTDAPLKRFGGTITSGNQIITTRCPDADCTRVDFVTLSSAAPTIEKNIELLQSFAIPNAAELEKLLKNANRDDHQYNPAYPYGYTILALVLMVNEPYKWPLIPVVVGVTLPYDTIRLLVETTTWAGRAIAVPFQNHRLKKAMRILLNPELKDTTLKLASHRFVILEKALK